ncbi:hypothetical protein GH714_014622 [Hevea brasiliensis]|uniref:Uncharacterized protein n=1 Tax=Hevea brasiliensis TaxID=3981 RepID=A0A6A6KT18_HEVBR|nr:hypothetical protein GH714_014622 [Hevea brasiliensis]
MTVLRQLPPARLDANRHISSLYHAQEPPIFNDDETLDQQHEIAERNVSVKDDVGDPDSVGTIEAPVTSRRHINSSDHTELLQVSEILVLQLT